MDFALTEEQQMMRDAARRFAEERIRPTMEEDEKNHYYRKELVKEMAELGFFGCLAPEEYGGTEVGHLAASIMAMELARVSPSWGLPFNMQMNGLQTVLLNFGTEEQKKKYLPGLINADLFGCFAITEPNTGSDVASMKTWAAEKDDCFVLNGNKMWISNVPHAHLGVVYAVTDPEAKPKHRGISAFLVDMQSKGIVQEPIETKLGLHCAPTGEIYFEDVEVPKENLVGKLGDGFKICMNMLDVTRLSCAARAVGVGQGCIDACVQYVKERTQFGRPIGEFQMIQASIAEMVVEHEAAKLLVYQAATLKDEGTRRSTFETSMAKYFAAEAAVHAANEACKIFGSYGFSSEYPVERFLRDSKSFQVVEGTSNIQKMIIARNVMGD
ncbi:MAG: acyl-CoA dehydrogenase family protein [Deltaproteobacteria bacterium]|nr:acyl-CoA dehydrogenase family protein [Candidatus Anaeroferrophillus wilburensis]MBN2889294.1 acyl-CoA dehydrogenase family protein [Deltaproteobacteria bacterium]